MGFLTLILMLIPLLIQLYQWLTKKHLADLTPRQAERLSQLLRQCDKVHGELRRMGVNASDKDDPDHMHGIGEP